MIKPIVVVGSINMDLVVRTAAIPRPGETLIGESFAKFHGGKGANQALAIARLDYPVRMIGAVGDDAFGNELRGGLAAENVDVSLVDTAGASSGVALICSRDDGENSIVVAPGANAFVTPRALEGCRDALSQAGMILAQLEIPMETIEWLASFAGEQCIPLLLDPAPAFPLQRTILERATWLTPNASEAKSLTGADGETSILASLRDRGADNVVLKQGAKGCVVAPVGQPPTSVPAISVRARDTTGAGDAFNAGFAVALMQGKSAIEAARYASIVAGLSVTSHGAQPSMPRAAAVAAWPSNQA